MYMLSLFATAILNPLILQINCFQFEMPTVFFINVEYTTVTVIMSEENRFAKLDYSFYSGKSGSDGEYNLRSQL